MVRISRNRLDMEEGRIDRAVFKDYGETLVGGLDGINSSTAYTIDLENGNAFHVILTGNCTFTFSNPTPVGSAQTFTLFLKQDSVGGRTVTWPTSVLWAQGYVPTITAQKNRYDIFQFTTTNAGATWHGFVGAQNFQEKVTLWSWGIGLNGTTGLNDEVSISSPTQIGALTNWAQISGNGTTLATKTDGTLWSWGQGTNGPLGHNSTISRSSPTQVGTLTNWAQVSGNTAAFAIKTDGTLWSWGSNTSGRLGHNDTISRSSPAQIGALTNWAQVSVNTTTLGIKTDGTLWSWGSNTNGTLGHNDTIPRSSPTQVGGLSDWAQVSAGDSHIIALKTNGTLWSWGQGQNGLTAQGDVLSRSSPTQVGALTNWAQVSAGSNHAIALRTDGTIWIWGMNDFGQLGQNGPFSVRRSSPTQVGALTNWAQVSAGDNHNLAIKTDGTLWSWGSGSSGILGHDSSINRSSPTQVGTLTTWKKILAGASHSVALRLP